MKWTKWTPKMPGWYWFRYGPDDNDPWVVRVQKTGNGMMEMYRVGHGDPYILGKDDGEWKGPIGTGETMNIPAEIGLALRSIVLAVGLVLAAILLCWLWRWMLP